MADTSARMLRLLSLLQTHRFWAGGDLAARLEVSERTLRRDVDRLRELGYPVDASRGVAGGYQLRSGAAMPPLLLDDEEAVAIAVGLRASANGAVRGAEEVAVRALAKVIQVMPPRLRRRVEALRNYTVATPWRGRSGPEVGAEELTVLAQACRDDERLRFGYVAHDKTVSKRHVEPHRLVSRGRRWYLIGWDVDRGDWRTYRVDRITEPRATGARFRQRELPGGDPAKFVADRIDALQKRHQVVIRFAAPAADVEPITVYTGGTVEPLGDAACRLLMETSELDWPLFVLAALGHDFEVEGPAELRDRVAQTAGLFTRCAQSPPASGASRQ
jgi:predicted DNA-binding transcriptional regulator YafY